MPFAKRCASPRNTSVAKNEGYSVLTAEDAPTGLWLLFTRHGVDAVVLADHLPGMGGELVASIISNEQPDIPIIVLTHFNVLPPALVAVSDAVLNKDDPPRLLLTALLEWIKGRPEKPPAKISPAVGKSRKLRKQTQALCWEGQAASALLALRMASVMDRVDREHRETEAALMRSEKLSIAGRMAATVAHEINNPLQAVADLVYLLHCEGLPDDKRREYLKLVQQELDRLAAIARRTMGFYKDQAGPIEITVGEVVEAVLNVYSVRLQQKNIAASRSICGDGHILASRGEVQQVLANLVANAIDAMPTQGGRLNISTVVRDEVLTIEVADNGHGISDENVGRIFEPFFSTKKEIGTGLGLWVSRDLVRKNRGAIEVQSSTRDLDHGTAFRISFPVVRRKSSRRDISAADCA